MRTARFYSELKRIWVSTWKAPLRLAPIFFLLWSADVTSALINQQKPGSWKVRNCFWSESFNDFQTLINRRIKPPHTTAKSTRNTRYRPSYTF
ncbi:hypothetical protein JB92DRAFT_3050094 [Gautieria morchelliformis]|nr:hypothetical protein JB92DRAFT_3050094 [Gautieria morchelliformis]